VHLQALDFVGMPDLLLAWIAVGIILTLITRKSSAGLPLAYFLGLSLIHVPGAVIHLEAEELDYTMLGFEQTIFGMISFLVGVLIARATVFLLREKREIKNSDADGPNHPSSGSATELNRLALHYCLLGGAAYFIVMPLAGAIPSATAIISSFGSLIIVGVCLRLWVAQEGGNRLKFWSTIAALPLLPLATLLQGGFLGFGTMWVMAISTFLFAQSKRRLLLLFVAPVILFVGMSVFVNYMASRDDIRRLVWYRQASLSDRLERIEDIFVSFAWLDFSNVRHRRSIDLRLNQNALVGAAVARLDAGLVPYSSGGTVTNMIVGLIPRALWPDKPAVGGGGDVVSKFTGIAFSRGTSVGAGQVLEFYVNFGTWGVIGGFLTFGWLLGYMDLRVIGSLRMGDERRFLSWFLIGVSLLQPGGNLVEIVVAVAGAASGAYGLNHLLHRRRAAARFQIISYKSPI
jgi:hypothetical protein